MTRLIQRLWQRLMHRDRRPIVAGPIYVDGQLWEPTYCDPNAITREIILPKL